MEAMELLAKYEIPFMESAVAKNPDDAQRLAESIGYPLAMKIAAKGVVHKTDIGAVRLNVKPEEVKEAYSEIVQNAVKANVEYEGVLIQQMAKQGIEVIVGIKQDPTFGPVILFGLGGIYAEAIRDVSIRVCPITEKDAREMVTGLRSSAIFSARGIEYDTDALVTLLMKVNNMATSEEVKELDLNPVIVYQKEKGGGFDVVDVRTV